MDNLPRHQGNVVSIAWLFAIALVWVPILAGAPARAAETQGDAFPRSALEIRTKQGRQWFNIRVADTPSRQERGLMFVRILPSDEGMLFPQLQPRVMAMWMKNTFIPLDMLFIDSRGRVVCLRERTVPESLDIVSCDQPVKAVLEIGGGQADKRGIAVGDRVIHKLFGP